MNRRKMIEGAVIGAAGAAAGTQLWPRRSLPRRETRSVVAIIRCASYARCYQAIDDGLRLLAPAVKGQARFTQT